jgi:hypothetical protein
VAGLVLHFPEQLFGVSRVLVAEYLDLGATEPCAINDAGVVQLVRDNEIIFAQDGRDRSRVGGEAGLEDNAG